MKASCIIPAIFSLFLFNSAHAANIDAKIILSSKTSARLIVSTRNSNGVTRGDFLSLGSKCELEVIKAMEDRIILDSSLCEEKQYLKEGRTVLLVQEAALERAKQNDVRYISASETRTRSIKKPVDMNNYVTRGFQISIAKAFLSTDSDKDNYNNNYGYYYGLNEEMTSQYTVGFGYTRIPVRTVGGIGLLKYSQLETTYDYEANVVRLEGSATYGFNKNIYAYGGLNLVKYGSSAYENADPLPGVQVGMGFQLNRFLGADIRHFITRVNQSGFNGDYELKTTGTEFGLTTTF